MGVFQSSGSDDVEESDEKENTHYTGADDKPSFHFLTTPGA